MSIEENKALVRRLWEEVNKGNLDIWNELCIPEYVYHGTTSDMTLEQSKTHAAGTLTAFPDLNCSVYEMVAEGDYIANRYIMRGTHRGTYRGMAPTGKRIEITCIEINRIDGGKFVETWGITDTLGLLRQLGINL
jgi:predicted ester cyclase